MTKFDIKSYIVFLIVLLLVDSIYLFSLKKVHSKVIQKVQGSPLEIKYFPASLFYLMAPLGYIFLIKPLANKNNSKIMMYGLLVGLLMYGTFDATNLALFKNYPGWYALMDTLWGMFAIMITSIITNKIVG